MLPLALGLPKAGPLSILCLGAHADDIEIGCGGTIMRLLSERSNVSVYWAVMTSDAIRAREARKAAGRVLRRAANRHVQIEDFRDGFLPYEGAAVKNVFEGIKRAVEPDLVFTHYRDDRHQDHRFVSELTWNTFRDHLILEYEIPKYDGDLGRPNVFVPLNASIRRKKLNLLMSSFPSQAGKRWYSASTFDALLCLRGIECGAPEGYAEAFHAHKLVVLR